MNNSVLNRQLRASSRPTGLIPTISLALVLLSSLGSWFAIPARATCHACSETPGYRFVGPEVKSGTYSYTEEGEGGTNQTVVVDGFLARMTFEVYWYEKNESASNPWSPCAVKSTTLYDAEFGGRTYEEAWNAVALNYQAWRQGFYVGVSNCVPNAAKCKILPSFGNGSPTTAALCACENGTECIENPSPAWPPPTCPTCGKTGKNGTCMIQASNTNDFYTGYGIVISQDSEGDPDKNDPCDCLDSCTVIEIPDVQCFNCEGVLQDCATLKCGPCSASDSKGSPCAKTCPPGGAGGGSSMQKFTESVVSSKYQSDRGKTPAEFGMGFMADLFASAAYVREEAPNHFLFRITTKDGTFYIRANQAAAVSNLVSCPPPCLAAPTTTVNLAGGPNSGPIGAIKERNGLPELQVTHGMHKYFFSLPLQNQTNQVRRIQQIELPGGDIQPLSGPPVRIADKGPELIVERDANGLLSKLWDGTNTYFNIQSTSGRVDTVTLPSGDVYAEFDYANGHLTRRYIRGQGAMLFDYDANGFLDFIQNPDGTQISYTNTVSETVDLYGFAKYVVSSTVIPQAWDPPEPPDDTYHTDPGSGVVTRHSFRMTSLNADGSPHYEYSQHWTEKSVQIDGIGLCDIEYAEDYDGSLTVTHRLLRNGPPRTVLVQRSSPFEDGSGATNTVTTSTRSFYDDSGNVTNRVSVTGLAPVIPTGAEPGDRYTYDVHNRRVSHTNERGITNVTGYYETMGGQISHLVTNVVTLVDSSLVTRTSFEYYPESDPSYRALRLHKKWEWNGSNLFVSATYTYVDADPTSPQNIGKVRRIVYADNTFDYWEYSCCGPSLHVDRQGGHTVYEYDEEMGRLVHTTHPDGSEERIEYDPNLNRITARVDALGVRQEYSYDDAGRQYLARYVNGPLHGGEEETHWRLDGRVDWQRDATGTITSNVYDTVHGHLVATYINGSLSSSRHYNAAHQVDQETDARGLTLVHRYDMHGRRVRTDWPDSTFTKTIYDEFGQARTNIDRLARTTLLEYDGFGRVTAQTTPDNIRRETLYNEQGKPETVTVMPADSPYNDTNTVSLVTTFQYDTLGRRIRTTLPDMAWEGVSYPASNTVKRTDRWGYDFTAYQSPDNRISTLTSHTGETVNSQSNSYQVVGGITTLVTQVTGPDGISLTSHRYHAVLPLSDVLGPHLALLQSHPSRQFVTTNGTVITEHFSVIHPWMGGFYGNTLNTATEIGVTVAKVVYPGNTFTISFQGPHGPIAERNRAGELTTHHYDAHGRKVLTIDHAGHAVRYGYNRAGDMTDLWDQKDNHTMWDFDSEGRMLRKVYPDGVDWVYTYDANGNLKTRRDGKARGFVPEVLTRYQYDDGGRLTLVDYPHDADVVHGYNGFGTRIVSSTVATNGQVIASLSNAVDKVQNRLWEQSGFSADVRVNIQELAGRLIRYDLDMANEVNYGYDHLGRITSVGTGTNVFGYTYIGASRKIDKQTLDGKKHVDNDYDSLGRLDTKRNYAQDVLIPGVPGMFDYTLDNADRRTAVTRGDGSRIDYTYDAIGQLTSAVRKFASGDVDHSYRYQYGYDPSGNPTNRVENGQARTYTSNELNQLETGEGPTHTDVSGRFAGNAAGVTVNGHPATLQPEPKAFYKDGLPLAAGTNLFTAVLADTLGRTATNRSTVVKEAAPVFSYDDNGNMLSDGTWNYTWDDENRLLTVEPVQPKPGDKKVQNYYDPLSRRAAKHVYVRNAAGTWDAEKEIRFTWLDWLMVQEQIQSGAPSERKRYTWGVDLSGSLQGAGAVGGLLRAEGEHNQLTFALHPAYDGNGNVVAHLNHGGTVSEFVYNPFGRPVIEATTGTGQSTFLFSTKYFDEEIGMSYYGYRFYNFILNRWVTRDPIGEKDSTNLFQFCLQRPSSCIDSDGRKVIALPKEGETNESLELFNKLLGKMMEKAQNLHDKAAYNIMREALASENTVCTIYLSMKTQTKGVLFGDYINHTIDIGDIDKLPEWGPANKYAMLYHEVFEAYFMQADNHKSGASNNYLWNKHHTDALQYEADLAQGWRRIDMPNKETIDASQVVYISEYYRYIDGTSKTKELRQTTKTRWTVDPSTGNILKVDWDEMIQTKKME